MPASPLSPTGDVPVIPAHHLKDISELGQGVCSVDDSKSTSSGIVPAEPRSGAGAVVCKGAPGCPDPTRPANTDHSRDFDLFYQEIQTRTGLSHKQAVGSSACRQPPTASILLQPNQGSLHCMHRDSRAQRRPVLLSTVCRTALRCWSVVRPQVYCGLPWLWHGGCASGRAQAAASFHSARAHVWRLN